MRTYLFLFCILFINNCVAQNNVKNIYVSATNGNDQWDGLKKTHLGSSGPVATVKQANEIVKAYNNGQFDTIFVNIDAGLYLSTGPTVFSPENGGKGKTYIIYQAANSSNKPVFSGAKVITAKVDGNTEILKIPLPDAQTGKLYFEQLFLNEQFLQRAREPNSGVLRLDAIKEDTLQPPKTKDGGTEMSLHFFQNKSILNDGIFAKMSNLSPSNLNNILVTIMYKWNVAKRYVNKLDQQSKSFVTKGRGEGAILKWNPGTLFYLENSIAFLDTLNEWFLDKEGGMLYYYNGKKYKNTTLTFYAPGVETIFAVRGTDGNKVQNLIFRNLCFQYSALFTPPSGVEGTQTTPWLSAAFSADFSQNISIDGCDFKNLGNSGVWMKTACTNNTISNCLFQNLGLSGVKVGDFGMKPDNQITKQVIIDNNIIQTGGLIYPSAPGIVLYLTANNRVTHNEISDFKYSGISNGFTWGLVKTPNENNYFGYNHIHHIGWGVMDDLAGIYTLGESYNTVIENNLVHDIYCYRFGANGIYLDNGSSGITVRNNLVYNCQSEGFLFSQGQNNIIKNNIFATNYLAQLFFAFSRPDGPPQMRFTNNIVYYNHGKLFTEHWSESKFISDSNCYWGTTDNAATMFGGVDINTWRRQSGKDAHSIVQNPGFINPGQFDFGFASLNVPNKIGFVPFSISDVGVRGRDVWKEKSRLPQNNIMNFMRSVSNYSTIK